MLYRNPGKCVWASKQGTWHWDTEYVIEAQVRDGTIVTRLLAADGKTQIATSPKVTLTAAELKRPGLSGLHVWRGTGSFWDFSEGTRDPGRVAVAVAPAEAARPGLGRAFRVLSGDWVWATGSEEDAKATDTPGRVGLACTGAGDARVVSKSTHGARGLFSCAVVPGKSARSVSLLFQVDDQGNTGFECRIGKTC